MNPPRRDDEIRRLTTRALTRLERARVEERRRGDAPPQPGDLFLLRETADFDVQWAVTERHGESLFVVPADTHPLVGSTDVAVPASGPCGALTLRCGFGAWLPAAAFDPGLRTGVLAPPDLARARRKRSEVERGAVLGTADEREADAEPEYLGWAEDVLVRAQAALAGLERIYASGVDGASGEYPSAPSTVAEVIALACGEEIDPGLLRLLAHVHHVAARPHLDSPAAVALRDPRQAGWGVVFGAGVTPGVREALAPLIEHRRRQIGERFRRLELHPDEDPVKWLARHGVAAGEVRPAQVPYYLLLVGSPVEIPFRIQGFLGAQYAAGRLSFDEPDEYRRYAESVVAAEARPCGRVAVFFGPRHSGDALTRSTSEHLVGPLAAEAEQRGFATIRLVGEAATRARLAATLHGAEPPALVFCAGHGLTWDPGHPARRSRQGDVLCQDWPGPGAAAADHAFGVAEVTDAARVHGTLAFLPTSYSAGTATPGASEPFVASLPRRLLAHPQGAALAVIGLVDRGWNSAIVEEMARPYRAALGALLAGEPVGHAVRRIAERAAALAVELRALLDKRGLGLRTNDRDVAAAWIEGRQAGSVVVLGDPAARLRVKDH